MKKRNFLYILLPLSLVFSSCEPEFKDEIVFEPGEADFRNYVAVGNSLTAGYQSNALSREGQQNSYPAILARQFAQVEEGMGIFKQALLPGNTGEIGAGINATAFANNMVVPALKLDYKTDCRNDVSLSPVLNGNPYSYAEFMTNVGSEGPFNNYGIPGAKSYHLISNGFGNPANLASGNANPYYVRIVNPTNPDETVLEAALRANPTFFSIWIGNNDVLGYALSGGEGDVITDLTVFDAALFKITDDLRNNNAEGVIANIPDITSLPHFNTVPWNGLVLTQQAQVDALNNAYIQYNTAADANGIPRITFKLGPNPFVIKDDSIPAAMGGIRQIKSNELLTLTTPQDSIKCYGLGSTMGIGNKYVLDETEIINIKKAIQEFNTKISAYADLNDIALVDANALLKEFESGVSYDGVNYSTTFVTGGLFSLDGIHPNSRGHAIIANAHIDAINAKYNANVPKVNVNDYTGVVFP